MSSDELSEVKQLEQEDIDLDVMPAHLQMNIVPASKNLRTTSTQPKS